MPSEQTSLVSNQSPAVEMESKKSNNNEIGIIHDATSHFDDIHAPSAFGTSYLAWKNLVVTSHRNGKQLLKNVSGRITHGLYAIMGASGCGKTTLLNALACRTDIHCKVEGDIRLNGKKVTLAEIKKHCAYVMQDDMLNPHLTVEETLFYTAKLRLQPSLTDDERLQRVDEVIKTLGLEKCRNTIVGSSLEKGISGGEKKRLNIAIELLTKPYILFLDEPTSALDSATALSICETLKSLADRNICTIVTTIHQPQAKIYQLFDHLLLLKSGVILYQGKASEAIEHFAQAGYVCPQYVNPAEFLIDVIAPTGSSDAYKRKPLHSSSPTSAPATPASYDHNEQPQDQNLVIYDEDPVEQEKIQALLRKQTSFELNVNIDLPERERITWWKQFQILFRRTMREQMRKRNILITQVCQSIIMAILIGTVFLQIGTDQASQVRRQPVLFFCVINQGMFGALIVINSFPSERILSLRERQAGTYYASAYFLAKTTAETIISLIAPVVFSCVVYFLVGFQASASHFFIFMLFMVLCGLSATSLALCISALCRTTDLSITVLPLFLEISRLYGGFFLSPANLPSYFKWLDALSYVKYTYVGISLNELRGLELYCKPSQFTAAGTCPLTSGDQVITNLGLDFLSVGQCIGILILFITGTRLIAYLGVRFIKW